MDIILYLLQLIQQLYKQNCWLIHFICKYIPLKQWAFDDSHSPKYQMFQIDALPKIISFKQEWNWSDLISYYQERYDKTSKPVFRHGECNVPQSCTCPQCNAPYHFLMWNDGKKQSQLLCKVCQSLFSVASEGRFSKIYVLRCPHCDNALVHKKDHKHFIVHKCVNMKCPYYLKNLKKVSKKDLEDVYGKNKYKLHYIIDFFKMDLHLLPKNASSLKFSEFDKNVIGLCLTYKINLGLSLRKTAQALKDIHGISISHQQVANYCKTAAICIKPFTDNYDYGSGKVFTADETYIKVHDIMGAISGSSWTLPNAPSLGIVSHPKEMLVPAFSL